MLTVEPAAESIALAADEVRIVVGAAAKGGAAPRLDVATGARLSTRAMPAAVRAVAGRADIRGSAPDGQAPDGLVTLAEIADYVATRVPALTAAAGAGPQHPTLSPAGLLPFVTLPLAAERPPKTE